MRERSAVYWADQINVPVLIMHGTADRQIEASRTIQLAQKLQEHGKAYELVIYGGDNHGLTLNAVDREERILEWVRRHMRRSQ